MMSLIKNFFSQDNKKKSKHEIIVHPIDGHEEYRNPLPVINISFIFCNKNELLSSTNIQIIAEELNVDPLVVKEDLKSKESDKQIFDIYCRSKFKEIISYKKKLVNYLYKITLKN